MPLHVLDDNDSGYFRWRIGNFASGQIRGRLGNNIGHIGSHFGRLGSRLARMGAQNRSRYRDPYAAYGYRHTYYMDSEEDLNGSSDEQAWRSQDGSVVLGRNELATGCT